MPGKLGPGGADEPGKQRSGDIGAQDTADKLPPGWIKEIKYRKSGNRRKKDTHYVDPVSGYVFVTLKDVSRYLETGDIHSCVTKPRKRIINEEDLVPASDIKLESQEAAAKPTISPEEKPKREVKMEGASNYSETDTKLTPTSEGSNMLGESAKEVTLVNVAQTLDLLKHLKQKAIDKNPPKRLYKQQEKTVDMKIIDVDSIGLEDPPGKIDTTESLHPKKRGKRSCRLREKKSALEVSQLEHQNSEQQLSNHENDQQAGSKKTKAVQVATSLPDESEKFAELKVSSAADDYAVSQAGLSTNQLQAKAENAESDPASCSSLNQVGGAEKFDLSSSESALSSLYGSSSRDPSIEFAVKILMGEMPLPKEAGAIEECFRQQMSRDKPAKTPKPL